MLIYDALYSWAKHLQKERHTQNPTEHLLIEIFEKYIKEQKKSKKTPEWAKEIRDLIQDQIDTNLTLKELSKDLNIHPAYLSREFSKHFDNLSFGDYLRKQRIEKAIEYLNNSNYSLTKIAYLTGFSDQSHFTRIFKKQTGKSPSVFKKEFKKVKNKQKG
jgi:YesN/AraC family two-component response regulator